MLMEPQLQQVHRIVHGTPNFYSNADKQLLEDLVAQSKLFCDNFFYDSEHNDEHRLVKSLGYLEKLHSHTKGNILPSNSIVYQSAEKQFCMNGKPIRFKVLKNKPKNGDFKRRWNRYYETLKKYQEQYGHLNVTRSTAGHEELGNWVAEQRRKLKKGKLTFEQFQSLQELGFEWDRSYYFHKSFEKKRKHEHSAIKFSG
mmetsp:Transcript_21361/g.29888  ORF Transcript_21361/g.29888 Transcript_21361/m.29888 type:complete len:199 (+) Transcript_21361:1100-1696(+)